MASLTRYSKGYKIRYRIYYPDGSDRVAFAYRTTQREAIRLKGQAESLESITRQNTLTPDTAIPFVHHRLLTPQDLEAWFPKRATLTFDRRVLLREYDAACHEEMTSPQAMAINIGRAAKLIETLRNLSTLDEAGVRRWRQERATQVARKTVNLEHDVLRQLLDHCQRLGWRADNPARGLKKLEWKLARLPRALTFVQVQQTLERAREMGEGAPLGSLHAQLYRLVVAGIFFGLRRGELQHLLWSDTTGRQVYIQGKTLPGGGSWRPKDREARVISYPGIEKPISVVFGEELQAGYVFSPVCDRHRPFVADWLTKSVERVLKPLSPELSLHSLRHTFASWRLEMGDSLIRVQALMGHSSAQTLLRYAHVEPEPMHDLLPLL
jgi:integrase